MTPRASDLSTLEVARPSELANPARLSMLGISKRFGGTPALDNVDFEVAAGEIHALVGQNGAGKSTLMKIVAGDYTPDSGVVMIDGNTVEIRNPRQGLDAGVGIVYQELSLLPNMTIAENISLGREETRLGVVARDPARKMARPAWSTTFRPKRSPSLP